MCIAEKYMCFTEIFIIFFSSSFKIQTKDTAVRKLWTRQRRRSPGLELNKNILYWPLMVTPLDGPKTDFQDPKVCYSFAFRVGISFPSEQYLLMNKKSACRSTFFFYFGKHEVVSV